MALTKYTPNSDANDDVPTAADVPQPPAEGDAPAQPQTPTAGTKEKSKDTYIKMKLSADKATPDTWFKLTETKPDGVKVFTNDRKAMTAMIHPERSAVMLYKNESVANFYDADAKKRNAGLLGRFYVSATKPTADKPESRLYVSGKFHPEGLVEEGGALKVDSVKIFGGIVGLESDALMNSLKTKADADRARAEAYKNRDTAPTPPAASAPQAPAAPAMPRAGDDLEFGM